MRTCFIHVGTHKTGTTSIQFALHTRREELMRHGFLYPNSGIPAPHAGHHGISYELYGGPTNLSDCPNIRDLLEEVRRWDRDVIISAEGLGLAVHNRQKFAAFIARLQRFTPRIVVIVYFRNQVAYARSLYPTLLRNGYQDSLDAFLSSILRERMVSFVGTTFSFCYSHFLNLLPSNDKVEIVARSYERTAPGCIVADFLSILGLTLNDLLLESEPIANKSIPLADAFVSFYQNRKGRPMNAAEAWAIPAIRNALNVKDSDFTGLTKQRIIAEYDRSNRLVNSRFDSCELVSLATENAEVRSDDRLHLEHVFSDVTVRLIEEISAGFQERFSEVEAARTSALTERDSFASASQIAIAQRDQAIADRDENARNLERAIAERDSFASASHIAIAQRDQAIAERNQLRRAHAEALADRDANARKLERAIAERDAMFKSRSWRITAPLRRMRAWIGRHSTRQ